MFQLSCLRHFHYLTSSVKDHVIPIRLLDLQKKYKWMAIFAIVLGVTKLVQNFCALWVVSKQNRYRKNAEEIRTTFKDYFCGPGEVFWQWKVLI